MREIVLDTETTGFDAEGADRIVEIGALELLNHLPTGKTFHVYINPERSMPKEAFDVHGLGDEFLAGQPKFAEIAQGFVDFIGPDSKLVIHNASFDMKFLNAELRRAGHAVLPWARALDTLAMARERFPGSPATLDALCRRFGVDNSGRELHGALLDSELLAEVYLELIGGRQPDLVLAGPARDRDDSQSEGGVMRSRAQRPRPLPSRLSEAEAAAHAEFTASLGEDSLWARMSRG
ncbi:DNA polymerase III subunit epsilon [Paracoccus sp. 1_MG-2023]|uniref:DNA polymerase III subunit epsilon n=1 Tax=unclassified Paracoccus (in: a-proteobacteria) TaxID=2688777 RepID=UPI001C09410C|nr:MULTISPECIES: DNA polymerase III subunit epsilon [unclassified Paracoccus (in: a-proteobacteria)]MBU2957237.1 DNA polymerase III subunit epsilon [Paracoccus sp. C2R09]MDO6669124.1 DNA polymerase III subunit epsilon [Paracoccus sp. 1_MG-2023]